MVSTGRRYGYNVLQLIQVNRISSGFTAKFQPVSTEIGSTGTCGKGGACAASESETMQPSARKAHYSSLKDCLISQTTLQTDEVKNIPCGTR